MAQQSIVRDVARPPGAPTTSITSTMPPLRCRVQLSRTEVPEFLAGPRTVVHEASETAAVRFRSLRRKSP
jgi:hypothetical protein